MNNLRTALTAALVIFLAAACGSNDRSGTPAPSPHNETTPAPNVTRSLNTPAPAPSTTRTAVKPLPFNAGGLLTGTASPSLPDGEPGKVSVVQIGALFKDGADATLLPFAFRNNTGAGISAVQWTGTARSGGSLVGTGGSKGATTPAEIQPGEIGLAFIYFGRAKIPPEDVDYALTVSTSPVNRAPTSKAPLKVTEANVSGDAIVGAAVNATGKPLNGPFDAEVWCFDGDKLLTNTGDPADQNGPIAPDGQVTFSVPLHDRYCPTFTVGVEGFYGD
ncbi:hypothetical protein [Mycobacterium colombiense]|uniref:Uncharacterized protein n=1 Tax=Mycobacterium colombiense TaxID=339268 RepID=A0A1A2YVC9_9MYCO|nr:hypothetical protein [Mycobacterium colombiense]OBI40891.1 hypothetical protein A5708_24770 [Mycobacterium colombiense]